jgi:beta-lactamase regulating signal transducer with metallopeptidase domain
MDSFNTLTPHLLNWLFNYVVHSTILLGLASIAQYFGVLQSRRFAEIVWRLALVGGLATASLQLGLQLALQTSSVKDLVRTPQQIIGTHKPNLVPDSYKSIAAKEEIYSIPVPSTKHLATSIYPASNEKQITPRNDTVIRLPAGLQDLMSALILTWLIYSVLVVAKIMLGVHHLNRSANAMPVISRDDLDALLTQQLPNLDNSKRLRISTAFNSPFVCPNGVISLPAWALEQSNQSLCHAMLHHEIQHIIRRDGAWRIAHELMKNIFFFQILNRGAEKQLTLLAEIDCDQTAVRANGVDTFAQALVRCAEMAVASKHPTFAIPMAKNSSLLQRIDFILDEDNMNNTQSDIRKNRAVGIILSLFAAAIVMTAPTTSIAFINTDNPLIVSSPTPISKHDTSTSLAKVEKTLALSPIITPSTIDTSKAIASTLRSANQTKNSEVVQVEVPTLSSQVSNPEQLLTQAKQAFENKNYAQAFRIYSELADANNAEAQAMKGEMLWYGDGVATDPVAAKVWLAKAATQDYPKAKEFTQMFAEREKRQHELNFYTTKFDGGSLKWKEDTCETVIDALGDVDVYRENQESQKKKVDSVLDCYNSYIATIQRSLKTADYIPADLNHMMREDEIEKSKQLAKTVFFKEGLRAKSQIENRLIALQKKKNSLVDYESLLFRRLSSVEREPRESAITQVIYHPSGRRLNW